MDNGKIAQVDVRALAQLSRVEIFDSEIAKLETEILEILAFVDVIQAVDTSGVVAEKSLHNVLRADENPHESGMYTEALLRGAPAVVDNRIVVKQVVSRATSSH